ncbi:flagellar basal body L-ring protein FlgH [Pseudomonas corrugata]
MWKDDARSALLVMLLLPGVAGAQSLINPDGYRSLTGDRRGYHLGDTLTVLVVESTTAQSAAGTGADSNTDISARTGLDSNTHQASWA